MAGEPNNARLVVLLHDTEHHDLEPGPIDTCQVSAPSGDQTDRQGSFSEDLPTKNRELWGNFPQAYSMAGSIDSALYLSRRWEEVA